MRSDPTPSRSAPRRQADPAAGRGPQRGPAHGDRGSASARATVCLVGLGNIGSQLAGLVARMSGQVRKLILVDADAYTAANLSGQAITTADLGRPKVSVIADRLRLINPDLEVVALPERVEYVPRGLLRSDVIVAGLDSKRSRMAVSELGTRLGIPWIDAGVEPSQLLVRVSVFAPGPDAPCIECGFGDDDYAAIGQVRPCVAYRGSQAAAEPPATAAPAFLGALAASLAAAELAKLLAGRTAESLLGRELVMSASHHTHFVTMLRPKPDCRFNHAAWQISELDARPSDLSLAGLFHHAETRLLRYARSEVGGSGAVELRVEPHRFIRRLCCLDCGNSRDTLTLSGRQAPSPCECGGTPEVMEFYTLDRIAMANLSGPLASRSLADIGLVPGDVISLARGDAERHYELTAVDD